VYEYFAYSNYLNKLSLANIKYTDILGNLEKKR